MEMRWIMNTLRTKILVLVIVLAIICIAHSALGIASASKLKDESTTRAQQNIYAIHKLDILSKEFQEMQKLLYTYFVTGNDEAKIKVVERIEDITSKVDEAGKGFADKTDNLKIVINKLTQAVSNISTVIEDSARGIENAANETSVLAEEMQNINNDISDSIHAVNDMEQPCHKSSNV